MRISTLFVLLLVLFPHASPSIAQEYTGSLKEIFGGQPFLTISFKSEESILPGIFSGVATVRSEKIVHDRGTSLLCAHPVTVALAYHLAPLSSKALQVADAVGRHAILRRRHISRRYVSPSFRIHHSKQRLSVRQVGGTTIEIQLKVHQSLGPGVACKYLLKGRLAA